MLCSTCFQEIEKNKEIQIKGSIFCKKCVKADDKGNKKELVAKCHYCSTKIFSDNTFHEISKNWGSEFSEKITICRSCYYKKLLGGWKW